MTEITNQAEVTRLRQMCFKKHGCMGFWKLEYATMRLQDLIDIVNKTPGSAMQLTKVRNALRRLM